MSDATHLAAWQTKFEDWKQAAVPLFFGEGKARDFNAIENRGAVRERLRLAHATWGSYPWFQPEGEPFVRLDKPASETRFGLITTGGYSIEGQQQPHRPFPNFGDDAPLMHAIPLDVDRRKLRIDHFGYDHRFAEEDINVNLPLDRLSELEAAGSIGSIAPDTHALMGLLPNVVPLIRETIPALIQKFEADGAEAALLVPS